MPTHVTLDKDLEQIIELYTKTSVIEYNYYSLYVTQASCICAIINRIIFFLFGRFGYFLGEAADRNGKISMKQEYALIENYNQAKKELLTTLTLFSKYHTDASAKQNWERAKANYEQAAQERTNQIKQFIHVDLITRALILEWNRIYPPTLSIDKLGQKTSKSQQDVAHEQLTLQREAVTEQLKKAPDLDSLDTTLWATYFEAFKNYHTVSIKVDESDPAYFALFYKEILRIIEVIERSIDKQAQFRLAQALATRFELPKKDKQFLEHYLAWFMSANYTDFEFNSPSIIDHFSTTRQIEQAYILLQAYFKAAKDIYRSTQTNAKETEVILYAKKQLIILLSNLCAQCTKLKNPSFQSPSLQDLTQNLHYFEKGQNGVVNASGNAFIERALTWTNSDPQVPTSLPEPPLLPGSSSSPSSTATTSTSSSTAPPSSFSSPAPSPPEPSLLPEIPISTSQITPALQPVSQKAPEDFARLYGTEKNALARAFKRDYEANKISSKQISRFIEATKNYVQNSGPSRLLDLITPKSPSGGSALDELETEINLDPYSPLEPSLQLLALKMDLAKQWELCTLAFFSAEITKLLSTPAFENAFLPIPMEFNAAHYPKRPNLFQTFYNSIKALHRSVRSSESDQETFAFAKLKLKELCIHLANKNKDLYSKHISFWDPKNTHEVAYIQSIALLIKGILNFRSDASEEESALTEAFLSTLIT